MINILKLTSCKFISAQECLHNVFKTNPIFCRPKKSVTRSCSIVEKVLNNGICPNHLQKMTNHFVCSFKELEKKDTYSTCTRKGLYRTVFSVIRRIVHVEHVNFILISHNIILSDIVGNNAT